MLRTDKMGKIVEKKNKKIIVIAMSTILALIGVVCDVTGNIEWYGHIQATPELVSYIVLFIATLYYVLIGYKKPHGNLLRWTFLLLAFHHLNGIINVAMQIYNTNYNVDIMLIIIGLNGISALLIAYVSGRLDKIKKNYALLIVITLAQITISVLFIILYGVWSNPKFVIWNFSICLLWINLVIAYLIRYREHKEAGLADK